MFIWCFKFSSAPSDAKTRVMDCNNILIPPAILHGSPDPLIAALLPSFLSFGCPFSFASCALASLVRFHAYFPTHRFCFRSAVCPYLVEVVSSIGFAWLMAYFSSNHSISLTFSPTNARFNGSTLLFFAFSCIHSCR